jgi:uncharacterized protein (TIGR02271 family)
MEKHLPTSDAEKELESDGIPVVAEQLHVEKRDVVTGGVRVRKQIVEHTETIDEPLSHGEVHIEHVPIGRFVDQLPGVRSEGAVTIVPVIEEVAVVEKRLWLRAEVHITRLEIETHAPQEITLKREEVTIERLSAAEARAADQPERVGTPDATHSVKPPTPAGQPATPARSTEN